MSQTTTGILGFGDYAPDRVMTNDEWSQYVDTSDEWIASRTGIRRRRIAADDQTTVDLAAAAAERALEDAGLTAADIDEIVVATDTPEVYTPDTASFLQHRLGIGEVPAYDLGGSGCAGFVLALDLGVSRAIQKGRRVLIVGVELLSRMMDWQDRSTCVLFGDAAGAVVIGESDSAVELLSATAGTDGSRTGILSRDAGGTRLPFSLESAQRGEHLKINFSGREIFREAVKRMVQASQEVLDQAGKTAEELALVVPHQANARIIEAVRKALVLPEEKLFVNVEDYGNTGSASVPLALSQARRLGRIQPGDLVLLTAFGAGFHWAAALLRF
jgi:3-oxoacyl-[acyl-carrier-protein] synthase-3